MVDNNISVEVSGLRSGVSAIAARGEHTCAVIDGELRRWGSNFFGELGDGTGTDSATPVAVSGLRSGVIAIAAGEIIPVP